MATMIEQELLRTRAERDKLREENARLRETGKALSNLLNAGGRYVDGRGFKGPELTAFDKALEDSS